MCPRCKTRSVETRMGYCKPCRREYEREYRKRTNFHYHRQFRLHGIDEDTYNRLLEQQGGGCAICGNTESGHSSRSWYIDHDHSCCPGTHGCRNCIRGLLCMQCNAALGSLKDNPALLRRAADYLENPTWPARADAQHQEPTRAGAPA